MTKENIFYLYCKVYFAVVFHKKIIIFVGVKIYTEGCLKLLY